MEAIPQWWIVDDAGEKVFSGNFPQLNIPIGNGITLGDIEVDLNNIINSKKLTLIVDVEG